MKAVIGEVDEIETKNDLFDYVEKYFNIIQRFIVPHESAMT